MPDCIIYLLHSLEEDKKEFYVGSVNGGYDELRERMSRHRTSIVNPKDKGYNQKVHKYIRENGGFFKHSDEQTNYSIIEFFNCKYNYVRLERQKYWVQRLGATLNTYLPISKKWKDKCIHNLEKYRCPDCKGKILYSEPNPDDYCIAHNRLVYRCPDCKPIFCAHYKPLEECRNCWELYHKPT